MHTFHPHPLIVANEARLVATRYRLAASRRLLNPFFGVSGGGYSRLNEMARELLDCGDLLPIGGNVTWAGHGSGKTCCVCRKPVQGSEVEYEVELGQQRRLEGCHFECFIAWQEESRKVTAH